MSEKNFKIVFLQADATFQNIPFIGDLIDINDNEFLGSCLKEGCQSICRLHVDDHGFEVETVSQSWLTFLHSVQN